MRLLIPFLLLLLGACATMDTSMLETAKTIGEGKLKFTAYSGSNIMVHRMFSDYEYIPGFPEQTEADETASAPGLRVSYGLFEDTDVSFSSNLSNPLRNLKLSVKHSFGAINERLSYAILPGFYVGDGEDTGNMDEGSGRIDYQMIGLEMPLLFSYQADTALSLNFCVKGAYNRFKYRTVRYGEEHDWQDYENYLGALIFSPNMKFGTVSLMVPELGIYFIPVKDSDLEIIPTLNFGVGLEF